jgi:hypothetical protein
LPDLMCDSAGHTVEQVFKHRLGQPILGRTEEAIFGGMALRRSRDANREKAVWQHRASGRTNLHTAIS